jgi:hypothetical protein
MHGAHGITATGEVIPIQKVNEAYGRLLSSLNNWRGLEITADDANAVAAADEFAARLRRFDIK